MKSDVKLVTRHTRLPTSSNVAVYLISTKHRQKSTNVINITSNDMAAARAVFETAELLENIIILVPAAKIHFLKRVSRYWRQLITTSPRVRNARCLKPAWCANDGTPIYYPGPCIRLHPSFVCQANRPKRKAIHSLFEMHGRSAKELNGRRGNYATTPRCQTMGIKLNLCSLNGRSHPTSAQQDCTLYVKGEIKIGDILDVREKLLHTHERFVLQRHKISEGEAVRRSEREGYCTTMHFAETWRTEGLT